MFLFISSSTYETTAQMSKTSQKQYLSGIRTVVADWESVVTPPETISVNAAVNETVPLSAMCNNLPPVRSDILTSLSSAWCENAMLVTTTPASIQRCVAASISPLVSPSDSKITSASSVESNTSKSLIT